MHKAITILFSFLLQGACFSQNETWEGIADDTSKVKKILDYYSMQVFDDSLLREYFYYPKAGMATGVNWVIYYDKNKLTKAGENFFKEKYIYRIQYYPSGHKKHEIINSDDSLAWAGFQAHSWYENGKVKMERILNPNNDTIIDRYYYLSGKMRQKDISVGMAFMYSERWCENGQLINRWTSHQEKITEAIHYYCNGKMKIKFHLMNGTAVGKWEEWYENGQKKTDGQYAEVKHEQGYFPPSEETGKWSYWDENGKLSKEIYYEHGKIVKEVKH